MRTPDTRYFLGAPTREQAKRIFWKRLKRDSWISQAGEPQETELSVRLRNGSEICVIGLDRPERIEGQPWHGCHITEFANVHEHAWEANIRPVLSDTNGFAILESVPEGRNHFYDRCLYAAGGSLPVVGQGTGAYAEGPDGWCFYAWFSEDALPAAEIAAAKSEMSAPLFNQEYHASFDCYQGATYYGFTDKNVDPEKCVYDKSAPVYVGVDFNVNPMTAILCHIVDDKIYVFREYFLNNSNTRHLCEKICIDYPDVGMFDITPCQSSSARQTVADIGITDIRIMQAVFNEHGRKVSVHKRTKNPRIVDRVNVTNSLLEHGRLYITDQAKQLRKDWEHLSWKDGTRDLDLKDPMRGHISAACDYLCEYWFPIRAENIGESSLDLTL